MNFLKKRNMITDLRWIGILEGISFLLLLGIAMPLKYLAGQPEMVHVVGMAHGVLFMLYVVAVLRVTYFLKWSIGRMLIALAASLLPFGPFLLDPKLKIDEQEMFDQAANSKPQGQG